MIRNAGILPAFFSFFARQAGAISPHLTQFLVNTAGTVLAGYCFFGAVSPTKKPFFLYSANMRPHCDSFFHLR